MEKSLFFDAQIVDGEADRTYSAADLAALRRAYYDDGVLSADALAVRQTDAMTVTVAPGAAVISGYTYVLDETKTLALTALGNYPRNDLIALRLNIGERTMTPVVLTGPSSANPGLPTVHTSGNVIDLVLAKLSLPSTATTSLDGRLTDMRPLAEMRVMQAPFRAIVADAIAELPMLGASELAAVRSLLSRILTSGVGDKVLCDDGHYRSAAVTERVELARFDTPGEYTFDTAEHPTADGLYDVEVIGGGGAGGSVIGENKRGGGGGAGACVTAAGLRLSGAVEVNVGAGGAGSSGSNGSAGGESWFGPIFAEGGGGGAGAIGIGGGGGGETSPFFGESGKPGSLDTTQAAYLDECGAGAPSVFGAGAPGYENTEVSLGVNATNPGTGGSGAGGPAELAAVLAGGHGASGAVVVYGRVAPTEGA